MDKFSNKNNNNGLGIPPNKVGDEAIAGRVLQLLGSSHDDGSTPRILPPFRPSSSSSSSSRASTLDNDRLLPPLGGTFPLPFLSGMMNPPSRLNVLGSPMSLLSSLPDAAPRRFTQQQQQQQPAAPPSNNRFDAKAELYEIIRERARVQTLAEAAQLFNNPAALAAAVGGGGGASSQGFPIMLENIRALINNNNNNSGCSGGSASVAAACNQAVQATPAVHVEHNQPVRKKRTGFGVVVLPLKDKDRKATFPLPSSSSSSSTRSARAAAAAGCPPPYTTAPPKLQSLAETWKLLEQRATDPSKAPIPMPHVFVRECFVRSLHGNNGSERSFLKRRLEEKVQGILRSNHQRSDAAAAATTSASAASNSGEAHHRGGIVRLSSDASQSDGSASEPLKKRLKRNYAAAVSNQAAV